MTIIGKFRRTAKGKSHTKGKTSKPRASAIVKRINAKVNRPPTVDELHPTLSPATKEVLTSLLKNANQLVDADRIGTLIDIAVIAWHLKAIVDHLNSLDDYMNHEFDPFEYMTDAGSRILAKSGICETLQASHPDVWLALLDRRDGQ